MRRALLLVVLLVVMVVLLPPFVAEQLGEPQPAVALPAPGRAISIEQGRQLSVHDVGEGHPVVLVHGTPSAAADWADVPDLLAAQGHRVISYDRIGYGYSSRDDTGGGHYTYESSARDLVLLLDALGLESATLVGWSYGGAVVQTLAVTSPERVSQLVLVGSVGPVLSAHSEESLAAERLLLAPFGPAILRWIGRVPQLSEPLVQDSLVQAFAREQAIPAGWNLYTRALLQLPGTLEAYALESKRSTAAALQPEAIDVPTLVVQGADDYLVPHPVAVDLDQRLPNSKLDTVLQGSHMLPVTHGKLLAAKIHSHIVRNAVAFPEPEPEPKPEPEPEPEPEGDTPPPAGQSAP